VSVLRVEHGRRPWLPAASAIAGQVFDSFNVPRAGLLHASGLTYFFECILGDGGPAGMWAYSRVTDQEIEELQSADGPDEFDAVADRLVLNRRVTLAAAARDTIVYSTILDAHEEGPAGLAGRLMEQWQLVIQAHAELEEMIGAAGAAGLAGPAPSP
jgi:hypothetical protein